MKQLFVTILFLSFIPINSVAQENIKESLIGEWKIDLRPTPTSEGYYQPFVILSIKENSFTGTFYGSEVENPLINNNWDKLYFAFTTKDSSNDYYHSGYLMDGKLFGITYCPNRGFTSPWTGEKK